MKVFLLSLIAVIGIGVVAGFVLQNYGTRHADTAFSSPNVRVGPTGTIVDRQFSGTDEPSVTATREGEEGGRS